MKKEYLDTLNKSDRAIERSRLKRAADFETLIGKDLSELSLEEALSMISFCNFSSVLSAAVYVQTFKSYTDWCIATGKFAGPNVYNQIKSAELDKCISQFRKLQKYIEEDVVNSLVAQLENPMDKAIILGIYNGLMGENVKELSLLRKDHIDLKSGRVKVPIGIKEGNITTGREIILPKNVLSVLLEAMDQTSYSTGSKNLELIGPGIVKNVVRKKKSDEKPETEQEMLLHCQRRVIDRLKNFSNTYNIPNLTVKNLWFSGIIRAVREVSIRGNMTCMEVVKSEKFNKIRKQYGVNIDSIAFANRYKGYLL